MGKQGPFEKILGGMTSPRYICIRALTTRVLTGLTCMLIMQSVSLKPAGNSVNWPVNHLIVLIWSAIFICHVDGCVLYTR